MIIKYAIMLVKERLMTEIDLLSTPELFRIYDFVSTMRLVQVKNKPKKSNNTHYLKVRKALRSIRKPLSSFIISEREERI